MNVMNKIEIMNKLTRTFNKAGFQLKKHSPEILVGAGIVGVVTSAVMACKASTKLSAVLEENKQNVEQLNNYVEEHGYSEKYTEEDAKKDLAIMHTQTAVKVVKMYTPAVLLGVASIGAIVSGHKILNKRNAALAAAYATVDKGFKEYRSRVVERFGKELDKELKFNIKSKEVSEEVVDEETGEIQTVTGTVNVADVTPDHMFSDYAKCFDNGCIGWTKSAEDNLTFLKIQQSQFNDILKRRGHVFLNEVYEALGFPRTKAGQVVGWVYDELNPNGDNYIDFGIYDINKEANRLFVNGRESSIWLDFNVDGNIWELMK
jgi:hypothetical protein